MRFSNEDVRRYEYISLALLLIYIICLMYSPHLGFFIGCLLLLTPLGNYGLIRKSIVLIQIFLIIITVSSRQIGINIFSDDLLNTYMPIVHQIEQGQPFYDTSFKFELFFPLIIKTFLPLYGNFDARNVLTLIVAITMSLYFIWYVLFVEKFTERKNRGAIAALCMLMIQIGPLSQFLRQELATPILLLSLSYWLCGRRYLSMVLFLISFFIHTTSLIIFLIFLLSISKYKKIRHGIVLFSFIFSMMLYAAPNILVTFFNIIGASFFSAKINYYVGNSILSLPAALSAGKFIVIFLSTYLFKGEKGDNHFMQGISQFSFFIMMCCVPLIIFKSATRIGLIVTSFLSPLVLIYNLKGKEFWIGAFIIIISLLSLLFPGRLNGSVQEGFELWSNFDWIGTSPFYYIN
ncbi:MULTISPECIES: EpsG family protein [Klebsiella]|nr:EpsG family protein [Klebsiella quasipneumoniae]HBT6079744.1 hypothetical protein [Klebsiella quasipneumoniae]HBT6125255.1 hypothetical protein [Klebsiella quasipneumoniae]HBT6221617.1 hypothetical protein [Klebsiella quasipneumoniae]HBT6241690.1 hypothetical protein [Klebsiella quasipneumoniae]HDG7907738.1 EpsG family protein [Klebsiella quasipneumoniae]